MLRFARDVCETEASRNINHDNLDIGEQLLAGTRPGNTYLRINHLLEFRANAARLWVRALSCTGKEFVYNFVYFPYEMYLQTRVKRTQFKNIVSIYQSPHNCAACGHPRHVCVLLSAVASPQSSEPCVGQGKRLTYPIDIRDWVFNETREKTFPLLTKPQLYLIKEEKTRCIITIIKMTMISQTLK